MLVIENHQKRALFDSYSKNKTVQFFDLRYMSIANVSCFHYLVLDKS